MGCASSRTRDHVDRMAFNRSTTNRSRSDIGMEQNNPDIPTISSEELLLSQSTERMMQRDPMHRSSINDRWLNIGNSESPGRERGRRRGRGRRSLLVTHNRAERSRGNSPHPFIPDEIFGLDNLEAPYPVEIRQMNGTRSDNSELSQLRSELETFERIFQTLLRAQLDVSPRGNGTPLNINASQSCPPASKSVIERLPTMKITARDFEGERIKECSICFSEFQVDDTVCRLPCGHIFHGDCVSEWLKKKCTCPECRWELQTDDEIFERERLERVKSRKLSIKDHELDRLCLEALQDMVGTRDITDRDKLIETIKFSEDVNVITSI